LLAGANAALRAAGGHPLTLSRTESYIGVMVDDLITRGVAEPYRMFTSRAEFRLHLRSDNADQRLTALGIERGLVGEERAELYKAKVKSLDENRALLESLTVTPSAARQAGLNINADGQRRSAFNLLAYPDIESTDIARLWPEIATVPPAIMEQLSIDAQYAVYLDRQRADVAALRRDESVSIPEWLDYNVIPGLSIELRQKLAAQRPTTLAQAQSIEGMTPAAATLLLAIIRRGHLSKAG
jgi:tRNA uridine 5-carboxymethylaminomethyl modification enzyme